VTVAGPLLLASAADSGVAGAQAAKAKVKKKKRKK
jgi:hypothetical protein